MAQNAPNSVKSQFLIIKNFSRFYDLVSLNDTVNRMKNKKWAIVTLQKKRNKLEKWNMIRVSNITRPMRCWVIESNAIKWATNGIMSTQSKNTPCLIELNWIALQSVFWWISFPFHFSPLRGLLRLAAYTMMLKCETKWNGLIKENDFRPRFIHFYSIFRTNEKK